MPKKIKLICIHCGEEKESDRLDDPNPCAFQATRMHTWRPKNPIRKCPECGEAFEATPQTAQKAFLCPACTRDAIRTRTRQTT